MIMKKLKMILSEQFAIEESEITADMSFVDDIGVDSLDVVELTMALEEEFDIPEFSEDDIPKIVTVGDLARYIAEKID